LFLLLKQHSNIHKNTVSKNEEFCGTQSFDSSDMMYLLMPDRFANGTTITTVKTIPKKNTTENYLAEDTVAILRNYKKPRLYCVLGATTIWTPLCEDNDASYSYHTDNLMYIK
jgi:hypothetical protein